MFWMGVSEFLLKLTETLCLHSAKIRDGNELAITVMMENDRFPCISNAVLLKPLVQKCFHLRCDLTVFPAIGTDHNFRHL